MVVAVYLWIIILLYSISAIGRFILFFKTEHVSKIDLVESTVGLINSLGLYGYLTHREYFNQYFWFFIILVGIGFGLYGLFFSPKTREMIEKLGRKKTYMLLLGSQLVIAPHLYFLFQYSLSLTPS